MVFNLQKMSLASCITFEIQSIVILAIETGSHFTPTWGGAAVNQNRSMKLVRGIVDNFCQLKFSFSNCFALFITRRNITANVGSHVNLYHNGRIHKEIQEGIIKFDLQKSISLQRFQVSGWEYYEIKDVENNSRF